jgi:hypothetical protein
MDWKMLLAYISDSVDEELLLRNEYLIAENGVVKLTYLEVITRHREEQVAPRTALMRPWLCL